MGGELPGSRSHAFNSQGLALQYRFASMFPSIRLCMTAREFRRPYLKCHDRRRHKARWVGMTNRITFRCAGSARLCFSSAVVTLPLLLPPAVATAQKKDPAEVSSPPSGAIHAARENTELQFDCEGVPPFRTMRCRFFQVTFEEPSATKSKSSEAAAIDEARKLSPPQRQRAVRAYQKMCSGLGANDAAKEAELQTQPPGRQKFYRQWLAQTREICKCGDDLECYIKGLWRRGSGACKIQGFALTPIEFERTGKRTWMAKLPAGSCPGVTTVIVFEHEQDSEILWTMTQTRVGTGSANNALCPTELNKPAIYSWRYDNAEFVATCSSFRFGL